MLYVLFIITFCFLILNLIFTDGDYLHPATLFCEVFFLYEIICIIGQTTYAIHLHAETVAVLFCGFLLFTIVTMLSMRRVKVVSKQNVCNYEIKLIKIPNFLVYCLIVLQIITIFFFVQYLRAIAEAYGSGGGSLGEMINLYDTMTKFWSSTFISLNVPVPLIYRIGSPLTMAGGWLVLYVIVNNFFVNKKVKLCHMIVIFLLCVNILLNGSRSPLLRVVTFVIILIYVFRYRKYGRRKGNIENFFKLIGTIILVSIGMIGLLYVMGRAANLGSIWEYIFVYTGAPIVNLDTFISRGNIGFFSGMSELFGAQTFKALYEYIGKIFGIEAFTTIRGIGGFAFSSNGIEIGNVYTTYYKFLYDFGFFGVLPMIGIIAFYYVFSYKKVLKKPSKKTIDFRLLVYAYLFNDLVMLTFSNRFFETVCDAPFLKFILFAWILDGVIFENKISIGRYRIKIPSVRMRGN